MNTDATGTPATTPTTPMTVVPPETAPKFSLPPEVYKAAQEAALEMVTPDIMSGKKPEELDLGVLAQGLAMSLDLADHWKWFVKMVEEAIRRARKAYFELNDRLFEAAKAAHKADPNRNFLKHPLIVEGVQVPGRVLNAAWHAVAKEKEACREAQVSVIAEKLRAAMAERDKKKAKSGIKAA